jgi:hypothetical protein
MDKSALGALGLRPRPLAEPEQALEPKTEPKTEPKMSSKLERARTALRMDPIAS